MTIPESGLLQKQLEHLQALGAGNIDRAGLQRIQCLLGRVDTLNARLQQGILRQADQLLQALEQRVQQQIETDLMLQAGPENSPEIGAELTVSDHFDENRRLHLQQPGKAGLYRQTIMDLQQLRCRLSDSPAAALPQDHAHSFDEQLQSGDKQVKASGDPQYIPAEPPEYRLKAVDRYRQLAAQQKTESMVNKAIMTQPDSPGPLNPHMLAIKSLVTMRDLSLPYLNRFVGYIETVLWLEEQVDDKAGIPRKTLKKPRTT